MVAPKEKVAVLPSPTSNAFSTAGISLSATATVNLSLYGKTFSRTAGLSPEAPALGESDESAKITGLPVSFLSAMSITSSMVKTDFKTFWLQA